MTTSMRHLIDLLGNPPETDDLFPVPDARQVLAESVALTEGMVADRINAAMDAIKRKVGVPTPAILAQVATKAQKLFSGSANISRLLGRVKALGRTPVLLAVMVGICGTLIGLAPVPAQAELAANRIEQAIASKKVDEIVKKLASSGIKIQTGDQASLDLPPYLFPHVLKAAQALRAINDLEVGKGAVVESARELSNVIAIVYGIQQEKAEYKEIVRLYTPDKKLLLAEMKTDFIVQKGTPSFIDTSSTGIKFELFDTMEGIDPAIQREIDAFIHRKVIEEPMDLSEAPEGTFFCEQLLRKKANDILMLGAMLACQNGRVATSVEIGPGGVKVS